MSHPRGPIIPSIQKGIAKRWQAIEDGTREWWRGYRDWLRVERAPGTATLAPSTVVAGSKLRLKLTSPWARAASRLTDTLRWSRR